MPKLLSVIDELSHSSIDPLKTLAQTLKRWLEPIVCRWRFTRSNGIIAGFHRKMKLIQHLAYGFRNFNNYRLRVIEKRGSLTHHLVLSHQDILLFWSSTVYWSLYRSNSYKNQLTKWIHHVYQRFIISTLICPFQVPYFYKSLKSNPEFKNPTRARLFSGLVLL